MASVWPAKNDYATGDVLTAANMNGVGDDLNDVYNFSGYAAGKNKIINGDMFWNQRAFSTATSGGDAGYTVDRWYGRVSDGSVTTSVQQFTPGTAPVSGYEAKQFLRMAITTQTATSAQARFYQAIEDVRTLAGQTSTISFWAKAASGTPKIAIELSQNFGTGGSPSTGVNTYAGQVTLSTSWVRYSVTVAVPSISGKTLGTTDNTSALFLNLWLSAGSDLNSRTGSLGIQNSTFDIWGVQVEAGSTASIFQTATGTKQGELAACQRYYQRYSQTALTAQLVANASALSTTAVDFGFPTQVTFRTKPGSLETVNVGVYQFSNGTTYSNGTWSIPNDYGNPNIPLLRYTHGSAVFTANNICGLVTTSASNAGYIGLSAEL